MSEKGKVLTVRLDPEWCELLERCAQAEERDVAQQARWFIKRALEAWAAEHPEPEAEG